MDIVMKGWPPTCLQEPPPPQVFGCSASSSWGGCTEACCDGTLVSSPSAMALQGLVMPCLLPQHPCHNAISSDSCCHLHQCHKDLLCHHCPGPLCTTMLLLHCPLAPLLWHHLDRCCKDLLCPSACYCQCCTPTSSPHCCGTLVLPSL